MRYTKNTEESEPLVLVTGIIYRVTRLSMINDKLYIKRESLWRGAESWVVSLSWGAWRSARTCRRTNVGRAGSWWSTSLRVRVHGEKDSNQGARWKVCQLRITCLLEARKSLEWSKIIHLKHEWLARSVVNGNWITQSGRAWEIQQGNYLPSWS